MKTLVERRALFQLALSAGLSACGGDDDGSKGASSEADALNALIAVHDADYPHERIVNAALVSGENARDVLNQQLASGHPPDLFQENAYDIGTFFDEHPKGLEPLGDLFRELGLFDVVVPEVIDDVSFDGEVYSMPVNIHRENALHYNQRVFSELGLDAPTTLDELWSTCDKLKQAGITPLAISYKGWILGLVFNALAGASMGIEAYQAYFSGEKALDEPALRAAIELLDRVLTDYVNESASDPTFDWADAAELVLNGEAAMFIHGDWVKGYLTEQGLEPGDGFGVVGMPGAADLFLYGVDVFAMPVGAPHAEAAKDFLRTVASKAGQVAFNRLKGSSPIRLDTQIENLDVVGQATLLSLRDAKIRMLARGKAVWDEGLAAFAVSRDVDALIAVYRDNPPGK